MVSLRLSWDFPPVYTQSNHDATNPVCHFIFMVLKTYPGINHLNYIFLLQQFLFVMAAEQPIEQHAESRSLLIVSRNQKHSLSASALTSALSLVLRRPERLFYCSRPATLQLFYQSFTLCLRGRVYKSCYAALWNVSGGHAVEFPAHNIKTSEIVHPPCCVSLLCARVHVDWPKWRARTAHSSRTACPQMKACEYSATSFITVCVSLGQCVFVCTFAASACGTAAGKERVCYHITSQPHNENDL